MSFLWKGDLPSGGSVIRNEDKSYLKSSYSRVSMEQAIKNSSDEGENVVWTYDVKTELPIRLDDSKCGGITPITIIEAFSQTVAKHSKSYALASQKNVKAPWKKWTWKQYWDDCCAFAKSVISLGIQPRECTCIMGFNAPEWLISHFGFIFANCVPTGIYTTNNVEATKYVIDHTESKIAICDTLEQAKKFIAIKKTNPKLHTIVTYLEEPTPELRALGVTSFAEFLKLGKDVADSELSYRMSSQKPGHCAELVYTSGTTGNPKGVMLSHDNCVWTASVLQEYIHFTPNDRAVSFLPLSHIAAQVADIYLPLVSGLQLFFAQPDALKGSIVETLKNVQPTFFLAVPRVWEKFQEKLIEVGSSATGLRKKLSTWAKSTSHESLTNSLLHNKPVNTLFPVANMLTSLARKGLGLSQCRYFATGAAPMPTQTTNYFMQLGIPICDLFGMSECTGPETCSLPLYGGYKIGSIGRPLPGTDILILKKGYESNKGDDGIDVGEIAWRGRNVFMGYLKNKQATKDTIDKFGFMKSGDIGKVDRDGFVFITGRAKELLITAGGENVAPVPIEDQVKSVLPDLISNCQLIGDQKRFLSLLITLKNVPDKDGAPTRQLDPRVIEFLASKGCNVRTTNEARDHPVLHSIIYEAIKKVNENAVSKAQIIQKYRVLLDDYSMQGGELGPTLKMKRQVPLQKYASVIQEMYDAPDNEAHPGGLKNVKMQSKL